ncbi:hypothetical protein [Aeromicrobium sp. 179-A 4D2 NHS]|uniref:hypothetical protein n=1 Tax=Aeromicrobium sp. 179-A 4D2 NHS TaxID=3142375 RepID=UPI00399FB4D0
MADAHPPLTDTDPVNVEYGPEDYEPAEVSAAKDIVMEELHSLADSAFIDLGDDHGEIDAIGWADQIVEALLAAGVSIPESLAARHDLNPHG